MKYENIIWDLDGTIVDSVDAVVEIMKKTADIMDLDEDFQYDKPELFIGPSTEAYLENCFPHWSDELKAEYREKSDEVSRSASNDLMKIYGGIDDILKKAKLRGAKNYVCTAKDEVSAVKLLNEMGIDQHLDGIYGSSEDARNKDEIINQMLVEKKLLGSDCVMIGDRYTDIMGGKAHKTMTIGVLYGYGSRDELEECQADKIAENTQELHDLLFVSDL